MNKLSKKEVSPELFNIIHSLISQLADEFGVDHAFTIMGKGHILAASNNKNGVIFPSVIQNPSKKG